ncbi:MAG: ABC transporter substrate-binding protein [Candidatus Limivicinus sp.]
MKTLWQAKRIACLMLAMLLAAGGLSACAGQPTDNESVLPAEAQPGERILVTVDDEPDTVDFQSTTIHYTVALNVFDRLVETRVDSDGKVSIVPSLAQSWVVSEDGLRYTFHLREGVKFSNGSLLTSSDVYYTFKRLLTYPTSCNRDIAESILGAKALENRETNELEGFHVLNDRDFSITLEKPFAAFLECLSMPGASIMDAETTEKVGVRFGESAYHTVGTGPFVFYSWLPKQGIVLKANPDCWAGAPQYDGIELRFVTDPMAERMMYEDGEIDILDLDNLSDAAEYFIHGDIYQDKLVTVRQIGISYIALNESVKPLNNVKVRKALQLALNRQMLLDAVYSGRGDLENGIFPRGLKGYNPDLDEIPYDPDTARELLAEAGFPNGFDLVFSVKSSSAPLEREMVEMAASMWNKVGVRTEIEVLEESAFMERRKAGRLACYTATWSADYDDPDNFIYTFFGSAENTRFRSLCYQDEAMMKRVRDARSIMDEDVRMQEYQILEKQIIQDDAAWIPLYSRQHFYVLGDRLEKFCVSWNGWYTTSFREMELKEN